MIANISPSSQSYEDTYNTLKYSDRAKNIRMKVERNELNVEYHVSKYAEIITSLRDEISRLKGQIGVAQPRVDDERIFVKFDAIFDGMRVDYEKLLDLVENEKLRCVMHVYYSRIVSGNWSTEDKR